MGRGTIYKSDEGKKYMQEHYENYLQTLKFSVERLYIDTSFGKTHVLVAGPPEGKPLFIFQGGNCINPMTMSWFSPLTSRYRIYAPDTVGHPGFSDENRISAKDNSFALWIKEIMDFLHIESSAFIGPSYGAGILLRLATFMPNKIDCSVLVSPAGIQLGSKISMIKDILLPLMLYKLTSYDKYLNKITNIMSANSMKEEDKKIIGDVFKYVKLEQDMPKLTERNELLDYSSPTLTIVGKKDIFFPESRLKEATEEIISNLSYKAFDMGHFPNEVYLDKLNKEISEFLQYYY
ncbi:alpha/beta hydrolase [Bacillus spongiae]|uniref:Alpha/beta hydrolase n=1 Tax=Bacillus spongiae TaxID=2683610 RepID=A0ABU8HL00_9BACI